MIRDRLAAFLYWAAYWLERAADRVWYGKQHASRISVEEARMLLEAEHARLIEAER